MKYAIWGAGEVGKRAIQWLGGVRVECVIDNYQTGNVWGIQIITFSDFLTHYNKNSIIVVIASQNYAEEMEKVLLQENIVKYFVYENQKKLASYMLYGNHIELNYTEVLGKFKIFQYQNIGVLSNKEHLPLIISEIWFQKPDANVFIVGQCESRYTMGCERITIEDCETKVDCLVLGVEHSTNPIREYLSCNPHSYKIADISEVEDFEPVFQHPELEKFKNKHKGERIFVIGTGPSLTIDDLETLHRHNEICIGVNMIFLVYDRTNWRADYLGVTDLNEKYYDAQILENPGGELILGDGGIHWNQAHYLPERQYVHSKCKEFMPNHIQFSEDITKGVYCGATVIYDFGIQFAAYLGASEIYLLGVDFSFTDKHSDPMGHFIPDYLSKAKGDTFPLATQEKKDKILKEYESAELYSRKHGFRIYNATRGGNLEVFERVNFDSLFK